MVEASGMSVFIGKRFCFWRPVVKGREWVLSDSLSSAGSVLVRIRASFGWYIDAPGAPKPRMGEKWTFHQARYRAVSFLQGKAGGSSALLAEAEIRRLRRVNDSARLADTTPSVKV